MMARHTLFSTARPLVIAALHLPGLPGSANPEAPSLAQITDYALRNTRHAVEAGVDAVYIQDLGDYPVAPAVQPHTVAGVTAVGVALRREYPALKLGVCLMSHGAREPLAIAQAMTAQFVRLKVYVGAMVKAEGLLEGCAYEAVLYRRQIGATDIAILADVYDRTGEPLGRLPLAEEARQAAAYGRADGLILTGRTLDESVGMLNEVRDSKVEAPLLVGGGATADNLASFKGLVDGLVVSTAFKVKGGWTRDALSEDWDPARIAAFMRALG
jgi:membrane complex biogenesis BtpA family protein